MRTRAVAEIPGLEHRICAGLCTQHRATFPPFISFPAGMHAGRDCPPPRNRRQSPSSSPNSSHDKYPGGEGEVFVQKTRCNTETHPASSGRAGRVGFNSFNQKEALQ